MRPVVLPFSNTNLRLFIRAGASGAAVVVGIVNANICVSDGISPILLARPVVRSTLYSTDLPSLSMLAQ